jgi:SAM-dependent methyltransferase
VHKKNTTFNLKPNLLKQSLNRLVPSISLNIKSKINYQKLTTLLPQKAKILVIGGSIKGQGMDLLYNNASYEVVGSDVSFGPYTSIICDAHDIPFENESFDAVIVQAVLEHILEPKRSVYEIHRILKYAGIVYAETPFMQQVHMKEFDFTRFTYLGHRRLFREFEEIISGPVAGPAMALCWAYKYFLSSFTTSHILGCLIDRFAHATSFFLKYFDYYLIDKPGAYDAASAFFFMGRKSNSCLPDSELVKQFKGAR